jgi:hypothetical protein
MSGSARALVAGKCAAPPSTAQEAVAQGKPKQTHGNRQPPKLSYAIVPSFNRRDPMRLVLAVLFVVAATGLAGAQGNPNKSDEVLRQRILLKERFNKGWDVTVENSQDRIESRCKAEARRHYSVIHPIKRRKFLRDCIERKRR